MGNKIGYAVLVAVMLGVICYAMVSSIHKEEVLECNRWSQWSLESHGYWARWQIDQCKAHNIPLQ